MTVNSCLQCLLIVLHALTGIGAGFVCLYSLIGWDYGETCFPSLVDQHGYQIPFNDGLPVVCGGVVYGMAVIFSLNFIMCLIVYCFKENACISFIDLLLNIIYLAFAVMGGTAVTVYYVIWCNSLESKFVGSYGCEDAAQRYDSYNTTKLMSMYKLRMEVQMAGLWTLFPVIGFAVIVCSLTLRTLAKPDQRYRHMIHDETTPLLSHSSISVNDSSHSRSNHNLPNVTSGSTNPFDS